MSNTANKRPTSSDPLAASRIGTSPMPSAPSVEAVSDDIEPVVSLEPAEPPPVVERAVKRFRVLETAMVSNGPSTVTLPRGKVINTVLYSPDFFEQCKRAGVKLEELPSE